MKECQCPICKGTGKIPVAGWKNDVTNTRRNKKEMTDEKRIWAKTLKDKGYSFREITELMGYKNPNSIRYLLNETVPAK